MMFGGWPGDARRTAVWGIAVEPALSEGEAAPAMGAKAMGVPQRSQ
jgi:hypothetical protein